MNDRKPAVGVCLCGAVRATTKSMSRKVGACHCDMCRRWGGGPMLAVDCGGDVVFEGENHISVFDSSDWAARGFCTRCGTHLFYKLKPTGQYILPVGLFGEGYDFELDHQVFIDEKPDYYGFAQSTRTMTGQEVFEQYASGEGGDDAGSADS